MDYVCGGGGSEAFQEKIVSLKEIENACLQPTRKTGNGNVMLLMLMMMIRCNCGRDGSDSYCCYCSEGVCLSSSSCSRYVFLYYFAHLCLLVCLRVFTLLPCVSYVCVWQQKKGADILMHVGARICL